MAKERAVNFYSDTFYWEHLTFDNSQYVRIIEQYNFIRQVV
jgi:hypothetical protein